MTYDECNKNVVAISLEIFNFLRNHKDCENYYIASSALVDTMSRILISYYSNFEDSEQACDQYNKHIDLIHTIFKKSVKMGVEQLIKNRKHDETKKRK